MYLFRKITAPSCCPTSFPFLKNKTSVRPGKTVIFWGGKQPRSPSLWRQIKTAHARGQTAENFYFPHIARMCLPALA